jgi:hypothetical protein
MKRPSWETASKHLWFVDGSLRDIHVLDATLDDWRALIEVARTYPHQYSFEGEERDMPPVDEIFRSRKGSHLLLIKAGSVRIHAHFFAPDEIELDISPKEVAGPSEHQAVLGFLEAMADRLGKQVVLSMEGHLVAPLATYDPRRKQWA